MRALDGEHRVVVDPVGHLDLAEILRMLLEPGEVALVVGRVRDGQIAVGLEPVGEQIIEHATVFLTQHAVLRSADRDLSDVVREQPL